MEDFRLNLTLIVLLGSSLSALAEFPSQIVNSDAKFSYTIVKECEGSCVRFCCLNKTICEQENHFDLSPLAEASNLNSHYEVVTGRPSCKMYEEESWEFTQVKRFQF